MRTARGFTLIELLVSLAILAVAMAGAGLVVAAGASLARNAEQNAQSNDFASMAGEALTASLHSAGYGAGGSIQLNPGGVWVSPVFGTDGSGDGGSDELWTVVPDRNAFGEACGDGGSGPTGATTVIAAGTSGPLQVACATGYVQNQLLVATGLTTAALIKVSATAGGPPATISFPGSYADSQTGFKVGDMVYPAHVYHWSIGLSPSGYPALLKQPALPTASTSAPFFADDPSQPPQVFEGIEDLQIAYGLDTANTGDVTQYVFQPSFTYSGTNPFASGLRAMRVSVVARSLKTFQDTNAQVQNATVYAPLSLENHFPAATIDGFRRSIYSRRVELPNLASGNL